MFEVRVNIGRIATRIQRDVDILKDPLFFFFFLLIILVYSYLMQGAKIKSWKNVGRSFL